MQQLGPILEKLLLNDIERKLLSYCAKYKWLNKIFVIDANELNERMLKACNILLQDDLDKMLSISNSYDSFFQHFNVLFSDLLYYKKFLEATGKKHYSSKFISDNNFDIYINENTTFNNLLYKAFESINIKSSWMYNTKYNLDNAILVYKETEEKNIAIISVCERLPKILDWHINVYIVNNKKENKAFLYISNGYYEGYVYFDENTPMRSQDILCIINGIIKYMSNKQ
jgi:hypothetical protein